VDVIVYDGDPAAGGKEIGRQTIPHIAAPIDLDPKMVRLGFPYDMEGREHTIYAVVDPEGAIDEITEVNNSAGALVGP